MARGWVLIFLALIVAAPGTRAHGQTSDIPPIPEHERFLARNDLTVTLRLVSDRVQIDELPRVTAIFKNVGTKRLLIRKPSKDEIHLNPAVTIHSNSGQLHPLILSMCRCVYVGGVGRLRDLLVLESQQEYEVELSVPFVAAPGYQSWELVAQAAGLPPGDYFLRAVYQHAPDSAYPFYDVYESGAEHAWEGLNETAPVQFSVVPPSDARLQELIATINGSGNADAAVRIVGLARAPQAADAVVRRLQRQPPGMAGATTWQSGLQALSALGAIGDSEANSRLLAWIDTLSPQERSRAFSGLWLADALQPLMRTASACSGRTLVSSYGTELVREFVARCPQFAADARTTIRAPYDPDRQGGAWDAKAGSVSLGGSEIPRTFRCCSLWRAVKRPRSSEVRVAQWSLRNR
jgi:hypothetical protein